MLDEYALIPDIFDPDAYSNPDRIEMCLPHLRELILREALVSDLYDGYWKNYCLANLGTLHRYAKEILRKLILGNRLCVSPMACAQQPKSSVDWCTEALAGMGAHPLTGIIAGHATKQQFSGQNEVAAIEKLTGTAWYQSRSPSVEVERTTADFLKVLHRVLGQANSLMFIDPYLNPSARSYREFEKLLLPLTSRRLRPKLELHRSCEKVEGGGRIKPTETQWKEDFNGLGKALQAAGLTAEVFLWDDFHDRYLITDVIGISVSAGFDTTTSPDAWCTWGRLGREHKDGVQRKFDPSARVAGLRGRFTIP